MQLDEKNLQTKKLKGELKMSNEILWLVLLLVNFVFILASYKIFGKRGLFTWIAISAILANIQVAVTLELFGVVATLGNVIYGTSFLATDILSEKYGKQEARKAVLIGFFTLIVTTVIMQIIMKFTPLQDSQGLMNSVTNIFKLFPRIAVASMLAFVISQWHDTFAYEFWKKKFPKDSQIWIRNNASTLLSQLIDTAIFVTIAFWGVLPKEVLLEIAITTYVIKSLIAIADTPFIYIAAKINSYVIDDINKAA